MKFILGKKIGMTQIWKNDKIIPVTLIEAGPCVVAQIKTIPKDGYEAVQIGFGMAKKIPKTLTGHLKELGKFRYLREFRIQKPSYKRGDKIEVSQYALGDIVKVSGISKGKGFAGVVKRYGFKGGPATHGQKHSAREPGSIGAAHPEHVVKGKRMPGRMGGERVTSEGLEVIEINKEKNLLAIKGAVPGRKGTLLEIRSE